MQPHTLPERLLPTHTVTALKNPSRWMQSLQRTAYAQRRVHTSVCCECPSLRNCAALNARTHSLRTVSRTHMKNHLLVAQSARGNSEGNLKQCGLFFFLRITKSELPVSGWSTDCGEREGGGRRRRGVHSRIACAANSRALCGTP